MAEITRKSVEEISRRWVDSWAHPDAAAFAESYAETGEYIDHAFQIRRAGHEAIARHYKIWIGSVPNFEMQVEKFNVVGLQSMFSYVGSGTFENDLPVLAATGTTFTYQGFVVLTVNEAGLIERTEEFYSTNFPSGVPFKDYNFRGIDNSVAR